MSGGPRRAWLSHKQWRWVKWAWGGLLAAVGLLSLLATMESEALTAQGISYREIFARSWERLDPARPDPRPDPISLAQMLKVSPAAELRSEALSPSSPSRPLYVFMLDVSKSMRGTPIPLTEYERFLLRAMTGSPPNPDPVSPPRSRACRDARPFKPRPTGFDVAVVELCRYIMALPEGSRAALWTFGAMERRLVPERDDPRLWVDVQSRLNNNGRDPLRAPLPGLDAQDDHTDFESALASILGDYRTELSPGAEVHIVIVSDFIHDIDPGAATTETVAVPNVDLRGFLERQHRASMHVIQRLIRRLGNSGVIFHLAAVIGTQRFSSSVLTTVGDALDWESYRITQHEDASDMEFDFLQGYQEAPTPLAFDYEPGARRYQSIDLTIDTFSAGTGTAKVWVAGSSEGPAACGLSVRIDSWPAAGTLSGSTGSRRGPTLKSAGTSEVIEGIGPGHVLRVTPLWPVSPVDAAKCALLIAVHVSDAPGNNGDSMTAALPIVFKRRISWPGAAGIVAGVAAGIGAVLVMLGIPAVVAVRGGWRRLKPLGAKVRAYVGASTPSPGSGTSEAPEPTGPTEGAS